MDNQASPSMTDLPTLPSISPGVFSMGPSLPSYPNTAQSIIDLTYSPVHHSPPFGTFSGQHCETIDLTSDLDQEADKDDMRCCGSERFGCGRLLEHNGHQYTENLIFNEISYCFKCWKERKDWIKVPDSLTEEARRNDGIVAHRYRKRNIVKCG